MTGPSRWSAASGVQRGADYDERWQRMEAAGVSIHGEADFIGRFEPGSVLDAGCGTGRVAIELARRGSTSSVSISIRRCSTRRVPRHPNLRGSTAISGPSTSDVASTSSLPGNVMIFLATDTEADVVANLARHLEPEGVLVAGFQLGGRYDLHHYDADCAAAGLILVERYATWDGAPGAPAATTPSASTARRTREQLAGSSCKIVHALIGLSSISSGYPGHRMNRTVGWNGIA
ncbi:MAG: class I SAM-dependent methyltransferase [Ilumatobacteraceae bacterium]